MDDELVEVMLPGTPLEIHQRAEMHGATVRRELALVHVADERGNAPARLLWLSHQLNLRYAPFTTSQRDDLDGALGIGGNRADLAFVVPRHAADAAEELGAALDEVDAYCRSGELVALAATSEVLEYRRWFLQQFVEQLRNAADAEPWEAWIARHSQPRPGDPIADPEVSNTRRAPETLIVEDDLDLEGSAALRGTLADLLTDEVTDVTIDLSACSFIDSVGISLLLTTLQSLERAGGRLRAIGVKGRVRSTLAVSGVLELLVRD